MPELTSTPGALPGGSFSRILLIKPSSLGDIIHAIPVLRALRRAYPGAEIDWLINTSFAPLLEGDPDVSQLVTFDRRRFAHIGRSSRATRDFLRFVSALRQRRYELAIDLQGLFRTGFLAWACGAPTRIGFRRAREGARWFYTHLVETPDPDEHAVQRNLRAAALLKISTEPVDFGLRITDAGRAMIESVLREHDVAPKDALAVIAPGARWETKRWPIPSFVQVIEALQDEDHVRCLLVGSSDEAERCAEIARACRRQPIDLSGRTPLPQLLALIERADVVLCQDSAVAHLAAALNRPLACVIGPTHPRRTGPYERPAAVVRLPIECSPCYFRRLSQCPHHHRCMQDLPASGVLMALRRALGGPIAPAHPEPPSSDEPTGVSCR